MITMTKEMFIDVLFWIATTSWTVFGLCLLLHYLVMPLVLWNRKGYSQWNTLGENLRAVYWKRE
jgi:hypothetical protein